MDFWNRLKNEIKTKNTTQEWIAGKIGVPLSTFRKWMTRKTYPDIREGVEIAKLLEISAEYLVTGVEPKNFNNTEQELVRAYRKLSSTDQKKFMLTVNVWVAKDESRQIC